MAATTPLLRVSGISVWRGSRQVLEEVDLEVGRGEVVLHVGENGAGKSTLLRIVAGSLGFDSGDRTPGHNVEVAFFAQHQLEALRPELTVLQEVESQDLGRRLDKAGGNVSMAARAAAMDRSYLIQLLRKHGLP